MIFRLEKRRKTLGIGNYLFLKHEDIEDKIHRIILELWLLELFEKKKMLSSNP